ncbi:MAG: hypothetical protein COC06_03220 [Bacteroidales bacterium]|nr:MAG: hypothetical protein COC06_03220 [Bacteroidales bacterium]
MRLSVNIHENDMMCLNNDGRFVLDIKNIYEESEAVHINDKLGFSYFKFNNTDNFNIVEWQGMFTDDVRSTANASESVFGLNFIMDGVVGTEIGRIKETCKIGTNGFYSMNSESVRHTYFKKNIFSSSLSIAFHKHYLETLANKYPVFLGEAYKRFDSGETFKLATKSQNTSLEMIHIISQIKNAHLMGNARDIYTESKVLELLALQVQNDINYKENLNCNRFKSISDIEKIHEAKRLLILDLNQSPTIPELSKHVGINECKLKYGFKEVYRKTIYQYLFEHKMNLARELLLDTGYTIFEIAYKCGYDDAGHFSNAFKRKYGMNPREFRRGRATY